MKPPATRPLVVARRCLVFGMAVLLSACSADPAQPSSGLGGSSGSGAVGQAGSGGAGRGGDGAAGRVSASGGGSANPGSGGAGAGGAKMTGGEAGSGAAAGGSLGTAGSTSARGGSGGIGGAAAGGTAGAASPTGGAGGTDVPPVPADPALLTKCTGKGPIVCTIPVPSNGNYNVTVELGSATVASTSRVLAETGRLQTGTIALPAGSFSKQTFSVNVRTETHNLYNAPGMILNVEIDGAAPALNGLGFAPAPDLPTLFIVGDSTNVDWDPAYVAKIGAPLERGWGQEFSQYLVPGLPVANYADEGDTAGTLYATKFAARGAKMKAGDYLFIQFGHNDQKTQAGIDSYQTNLMKFVNDARAVGATPILFTPVGRKASTAAAPGFAGLDEQARQLAASQKIALVDLTAISDAYYASLTSAQLNATFYSPTEGTHFSESGATQIGGLVAKNLKASTVPIRAFLK